MKKNTITESHDFAKNGGGKFEHIKKYIDKISLKNLGKVNIPLLADKFKYNKEYITKNFKALYGINLKQYIIQVKIKKCKDILQSDPNITIKNFAEIAGYSRVDYFRKVFKKYNGVSHIIQTDLRDFTKSKKSSCLSNIDRIPYLKIFSIKDLHELAESRGGKCLSEKYIKSNSKYLWSCKKGHKWKATLNNTKTGTWCPVCNKSFYTLDDMHKLAESKGGKCLSDKYINLDQKIKWICNHGHTFESRLRSIIHNKRWCKTCVKIEKNKFKTYKQ